MKHNWIILCLLSLFIVAVANSQTLLKPQIIIVRSGSLKLSAELYRPAGRGPFPAVLFCPGSGQSPSPSDLGRLFAKHGYVFLAMYRKGQGLSADQGEESSRVWNRERETKGDDTANRLQLQLLESDDLQQELSGLEALRSLKVVDRSRVAVVGHSFGGSLAMLLAEREPSLRAVVNFGAAAGSWNRSSSLRERLIAAAQKVTTPVFFVYAANDYSTAPGEVLDGELKRAGKTPQLKIYPAFGETAGEGHSIIYLSAKTWERDVFAFLDEHTGK